MTTLENQSAPLWTRGMIAVLIAQFLSAMADNALLFAALALLKSEHYQDWAAPILQEFFAGAYIILAPFAGPFADSLPKGRVMLLANGLKLVGALGICLGLNPFLAYGLVGVGAAAYSPAKYGILSELTSKENLVKANSLIESSTIAAILAGAIAGGALSDWSVSGALALVTVCYGVAAAANLLIPRLPPAHRLASFSVTAVFHDFTKATVTLFRNPDARFSMTGTSLFWAAGSTLRFLLVAWVPVALGLTDNSTPAYLNAVVAVGIVIGAGLAGRFVTLDKAERALPAGALIGVSVCLLAFTTHLPLAYTIMVVIGACGGFFVVPLNALLQERGHGTVGTGHAIAVQNLTEYTAMLVMVAVYTLAVRAGAPITSLAAGFGAALALSIGTLWLHRRWHTRMAASAS
jgi:LPLT family lysophospholipid transporter-like MFS transporter